MPRPDMTTEPIRLPAWAAAIVATILPAIIAVLLEQEWRVALAGSLALLIPSVTGVAVAESRRARVDSPATVQAQLDAIDALYADAGHGED